MPLGIPRRCSESHEKKRERYRKPVREVSEDWCQLARIPAKNGKCGGRRGDSFLDVSVSRLSLRLTTSESASAGLCGFGSRKSRIQILSSRLDPSGYSALRCFSLSAWTSDTKRQGSVLQTTEICAPAWIPCLTRIIRNPKRKRGKHIEFLAHASGYDARCFRQDSRNTHSSNGLQRQTPTS